MVGREENGVVVWNHINILLRHACALSVDKQDRGGSHRSLEEAREAKIRSRLVQYKYNQTAGDTIVGKPTAFSCVNLKHLAQTVAIYKRERWLKTLLLATKSR